MECNEYSLGYFITDINVDNITVETKLKARNAKLQSCPRRHKKMHTFVVDSIDGNYPFPITTK